MKLGLMLAGKILDLGNQFKVLKLNKRAGL
jgi:hypothetical protein